MMLDVLKLLTMIIILNVKFFSFINENLDK